MRLSTIIITKDEERDIEDCLKSIQGITDEIIVVDSGSTDGTIEICRQYHAKVISHSWEGYGPQKQFALNQAMGEWVLNLDADERLSPALKTEIKQLVNQSDSKIVVNGFNIPFKLYFLGRLLHFGASWGETHIRLFRRDKAKYGHDLVHEGINVEPAIGNLNSPIEHHSYQNIDEYLKKCDEYTNLIAKKKFDKGKRFRLWYHLRLPYEFIIRYIIKLGFLDGIMGLKYAAFSSYYVWLKFAKLRDLEAK